MTNLAGKAALIIEDDSRSVRVLEQLLSRENMTSEAILNTHDIAEQLQIVTVPDVIFLDLEMPTTNGYTVLESIQADSRFDGVPVVAYTTHVSHLNDAKNAGFHSFLGKPLDGRQFAANLTRILDGERVWEIPG